MAKNNETTTKFLVDISDLKKSMQEAKRQISVANSEFKAVASTMDDWSKSTDGLSAKLSQLDSNLKSQKSILKSLEEQYELTVKEMGEGSKAADDLKIKINNQKAVVNKTEREIRNYESALEEVAEAEKTAAKTGRSVADVLADVGKKAEDAEDGFTTLKGAVSTFVGNAMTGLVSSIKDGISSIMGLAESTREYREDLGKLETAFSTAGHSTETATKTYKEFYAVLGEEDRAIEAVNHLAKLTDSEEDLAKWTDICAGVWGTFGDSLPVEGLTEASNETAKTGKLTGVLADALNWAGVSEEDFQESLDDCTTEQQRQAKITNTLNKLYKDAAKNYKQNNKAIIESRKASSNYADTLADLGEAFEPVQTSITKTKNSLLKELTPSIKKNVIPALKDFMSELSDGETLKNFSESVTNISTIALKAFGGALKFAAENLDTLIAVTGTAITTFATFKAAMAISTTITAVKTAIGGLSAGVKTATVVQTGWNAAMSANPIGAVLTAVGLLTAGIAVLASTTSSAKGNQDLLTESQRAAIDKGNELAESYRETKAAADELATSELTHIDYVQTLWEELQTLAGANGLVQEKDKARAEFILGELNEALGTEYEMTDNLINAYGEIQRSIEGVIETKKAQILLQAYEETYAQSIQNIAELEKTRATAAQELYAQEAVALAEKQAMEENYNRYQEAWSISEKEIYLKRYMQAKNNYEKESEILAEKQKEFDKTSGVVKENYDLINSYEEASTAVLNGETQKAIDLLSKYGNGFKTAASVAGKSKDEQVADLRQQVIDTEVNLGIMEAEYRSAWSNMTEEEKRQAKIRLDNARKQAADAKEEFAKVGGNMVDGLEQGVSGKGWKLSDSLASVVNSAVDAAKKALNIHSPSRVLRDEVGKMMSEGIAVGISQKAKSVLTSMKDVTAGAVAVAKEGLNAGGLSDSTLTGTGGKVTNTFIQNNYSPKALSRLEIYRQSKNLLGFAGGGR